MSPPGGGIEVQDTTMTARLGLFFFSCGLGGYRVVRPVFSAPPLPALPGCTCTSTASDVRIVPRGWGPLEGGHGAPGELGGYGVRRIPPQTALGLTYLRTSFLPSLIPLQLPIRGTAVLGEGCGSRPSSGHGSGPAQAVAPAALRRRRTPPGHWARSGAPRGVQGG